jgi:hypothetical protein
MPGKRSRIRWSLGLQELQDCVPGVVSGLGALHFSCHDFTF